METVNTFTKGLVSDKHPLTIGLDTMTDALNATLITYNGNEMILQNDMGNSRLAVPESTKQVRLTIYQDTQETTSKGYNTDINTVRDRLSDEDINLRSAFKPIGIVEHGGVLYIASLRDIYDENGNKIDTEFEIGSFPGPKIEEPNTIKLERNYDEVNAWDEITGKDKKVHILYDLDPRNIIQGELLTDHQETFRPGTPIEIFPQLSEPNSLSTPEKRRWYKLKILNLSDNNRDITEELMSCITWDKEDETSWGVTYLDKNPEYFYPNIKNAKLGFSIELEDIDAFLLDRVVGDTVEEKEYNNQRLPFLIEPIFPVSLKSKYAPNYSLDKDSYYLSINLFEIVQESDVKVNLYRVRYRLTNRNGSSINVNNNKLVEVDNNDWTVTNSLNLEEVSNNKFRSTSSGMNYSTIIPIGENKNVNIELEIYPESDDFKFNDGFYPFSNHVIRLNLNLWESPGMWGSTSYLTNESDYFDIINIERKVWYDMDEEETENPTYNIPILVKAREYSLRDTFFGYSPDWADSNIGYLPHFRPSSYYNSTILGKNLREEILTRSGEIASMHELKLDIDKSVFQKITMGASGSTEGRILNERGNDDETLMFSSALSILDNYGSFYNLKLISNEISIESDYVSLSGKCTTQNLILPGAPANSIAGKGLAVHYDVPGLMLEKASLGMVITIGNSYFPKYSEIKKDLLYPGCLYKPSLNGAYFSLFSDDTYKLANWDAHSDDFINTTDIKFLNIYTIKDNEKQRILVGAYSPIWLAFIKASGVADTHLYRVTYNGGANLDSDNTYLLYPYKATFNNGDGDGILEYYIKNQSDFEVNFKLKNSSDLTLNPLIYQITERDGVLFRTSTQNLEHVQNNKLLQINSVDSLKNSLLYLRSLDKYIDHSFTNNPTSFPITTEPYNYLIFDNIEIPWYSAAEGLYLSSYYILQFYFKKNTLNGKLQIAIESNNQSAIVEEKGYCLGISLNLCSFNSHNGLEITNDSTAYYTYIQIPICGTDINIFFKAIGLVEVRNIGILKKVLKNPYYEPKGAVLTYKEDILLCKKNNGDEVRSSGIFLPCLGNDGLYYEILTTKNNGTFSLPKLQDSEILIGDGKVTIDNNTYTIIL